MKKKMYLITKDYPIGSSETSFIDSEYKMLSEVFDISIVVTELKNGENSESEDKCRVIDLNPAFCDKLLCLIRFLLHKDAWIEIGAIIRERNNIAGNIFRALMYGTFAEAFFLRLKKAAGLSADTDAVFYFYWWDYKCLGLTMHKKRYPNIKIITRTHGYDLYDERELYGRQYFKPQMDRELDRIMFVARYGKRYYLEKYKKSDSVKYPVHCLGVYDPKIDLENGKGEVFHLVSCSNAVPLKRIELIIAGLSKIRDIQIKWVHMGDGPELDNLKSMAREKLGENIDYNFPGRIPNEDVIDYYKENNVSCFITTTSTEGNPVSVQEALSFGIPVIATSVSDIPLMIDQNGILLPENPTGDEVAEAVRTIAVVNDSDYIDLRKNSYRIYCRDYRVETNHRMLIEDLSQMHKG